MKTTFVAFLSFNHHQHFPFFSLSSSGLCYLFAQLMMPVDEVGREGNCILLT